MSDDSPAPEEDEKTEAKKHLKNNVKNIDTLSTTNKQLSTY